MSNGSKIDESDLSESEISLADVIEFLQESWKSIALLTVLGIAGAALFIWAIPKQYEASAQIKMAQIANLNNNINPLGINVEEARKKLRIEEDRLSRASQVIAKSDKSGAAVSAAYLATRDEIRYLLDQISNLQNIITGNESRAAHLTAHFLYRKEREFEELQSEIERLCSELVEGNPGPRSEISALPLGETAPLGKTV